jgi:hypothetical protein
MFLKCLSIHTQSIMWRRSRCLSNKAVSCFPQCERQNCQHSSKIIKPSDAIPTKKILQQNVDSNLPDSFYNYIFLKLLF